jgi:hypothetical protein
MFALCHTAVAETPVDPRFAAYKGAGMVFTDGSVVLCGWEPRKRKPGLYGIGGKAEDVLDQRNYQRTAAREVLEEIYGVPPSADLVDRIARVTGNGRRVEMVGDYVMIHQDFAGLEQILRLVASTGMRSPFYPSRAPRTVQELLFSRRPTETSEMAQLCLLPITSRVPRISSDLGGDIVRIWSQKEHTQ